MILEILNILVLLFRLSYIREHKFETKTKLILSDLLHCLWRTGAPLISLAQLPGIFTALTDHVLCTCTTELNTEYKINENKSYPRIYLRYILQAQVCKKIKTIAT